MKVFIFVVLCSMKTIVIGQSEPVWQEPVSGRDPTVEESYGPAPVNAPPVNPTIVTDPTAAIAYSAAIVQPAAAEPVQFPEQTTAIQTPLMPYSFEYGVDDDASGLDFGHKESSDGTVVTGTYYVLLPDGRMETVNYKADSNGYVADVSYQGEAKYDTVQTQQTGGGKSGTSGQLQASSNSGALSAAAPTIRPSQPSPAPNVAPKASISQATVPARAPIPQVSAPVWPAVKAPVVPIAPIVGPTPSVVPAAPAVVNVPAPVPVYGPAPASAPAANWTPGSTTTSQLSQGPAVQIPAPPAGFARSPVQLGVQAIAYGQAAPTVSSPSTIPAYPVVPIPLTQRNIPKPPSNPYSN